MAATGLKPLPKSKHRRQGKTYQRPSRTQRKMAAAKRGDGEISEDLLIAVHLVTERCELLYGPAPDDGWGRDRVLAAARQLEAEGIIVRDADRERGDVPASYEAEAEFD